MIEYIGYLASLIVLVSLLMSSVKKLRWINMVGSVIFAIYGILIGSYPVAVMNFGIVLVNIYYLVQMYGNKDLFKLIHVMDKPYFDHFIDVYKKDMNKYLELEHDITEEGLVKYFVSRNTVPAGLFIGKKIEDNKLEILVDYTTPTYRDFKIAEFLFVDQKDIFKKQGFDILLSKSGNEKHKLYLEKMGFKQTTYLDEPYYMKEI